MAYFKDAGGAKKIVGVQSFADDHGEHNMMNFLAAALAAHLAGTSWADIVRRMKTLPGIQFRQEIIFKNTKLTIVNDTTATSAEGGIAAAERFKGLAAVLIAGGTDRGLEYDGWAKVIRKDIKPQNLVLLTGSATLKMLASLGSFAREAVLCNSLEECLDAAFARAKTYKKATIVFSPGAKSFEKFKNEYDRGEQFNKLVKKKIGRP